MGNIEGTKMNPLLFQYDIFAVNRIKDIQETINIIETFQNLKRLQFHEEKSKKSILNGKRNEKVKVNGIEIERVTSHTYLGKIIEEKIKDKEEIQERLKKAKAQTTQSFVVIDRKKLNRKRIEVGIKLLQTVVIPTLTTGAETWTKLTEKEKHDINSIQTQYLTRLLKIPRTTPRSALLTETGLMKVEHIANQRKLEYYIDLNNREEWRLEVKMKNLQEQKNMSYKKEIEELTEKYNIRENLKIINAKEGKRIIKKAVKKYNDDEVKEEMNKGKKTKNMDTHCKKYLKKLKFDNASTIFMAVSGMLDLKANYRQKHLRGWNCDMCKNNKEENTQHIFECSAYEDLTKELKDRSSLQEILRKNETEKVAETIRKIISRRDEFQKMESPPLP